MLNLSFDHLIKRQPSVTVEALNHYSVRTADIRRSRDFYVEVLGLVQGERPPFPFPGYWLYCGDSAVVHIVGQGEDRGLDDYLGAAEPTPGGGSLDHIAFSARGLAQMRARLQRLQVPYRERTVPLLGLRQLFITDPDGITLELNFPESEV